MRVALVVQRFGIEVNGGSETLARRIAERIAENVDLTVLSTCALDYSTWANYYPPGRTDVNGVEVLRFPVRTPRDQAKFDAISVAAYATPNDPELGKRWMQAQGPDAPELLDYLRTRGGSYDAVAFMTYLYATTAEGLPLVADRSLLVPTVHDEPPLRLRLFDDIFAFPRLLLFSTPEERDLARRRFGVEDERARLVGVGVDEPPESDPSRFRAESGVGDRPYAIYVGRLDPSKGVLDLVEHHRRYREAADKPLDLVLIGGGEIDLPDEPWLHVLGFVSEQQKHDAVAGAEVVVLPSPYESLSLVQLEAWMHGRPTLANAESPVLAGQSSRGSGGLWYENASEYAVMLDFLGRSRPLGDAIGRQGRRYVRSAFTWRSVRDRWLDALAEVGGSAELRSSAADESKHDVNASRRR